MTRGTLNMIAGNMFSNKTGTLIHRIETLRLYAHKKIIVVKPVTDTRSGKDFIKNSQGKKMKAFELPPDRPQAIFDLIRAEESKLGTVLDIVAMDEIQFFSPEIYGTAAELLRRGYDMIEAGLMLDFRGEPFGSTLQLMGLCTSTNDIQMLVSYCAKCGDIAPLPQRLIDGKPAPYDSPIVLVGGRESYEARCYACHELPGRPAF